MWGKCSFLYVDKDRMVAHRVTEIPEVKICGENVLLYTSTNCFTPETSGQMHVSLSVSYLRLYDCQN